jgi:hypothetical protein
MPNPALRKYLPVPPGDLVIWRYVSLDKYLSLLTTSKLFLCRADKLEDPYESRIPNIANLDDFAGIKRSGPDLQQWRDHLSSFPRTYYVSCWHGNMGESAAMWDLYSSRNSGIAIKTTVQDLSDSFGRQVFDIGQVSYIDFNNYSPDFFPAPILVAFKKRLSFIHEQEVRVAIHRNLAPPLPNLSDDDSDISRSLDVDLKILCREIKFSPMMPKWLCDSIVEISSKYGLGPERFSKSDLYDRTVI